MFRRLSWLAVFLVVSGCSGSDQAGQRAGPSPEANPDLIKPLVLQSKPESALSVSQVREKKDGDEVVVTGRVPPENVKPFNDALATFLLMAPEDLENKDIKEELECEDAPTCPACQELLNTKGVRVELVDKAGVIVPASVKGFQGLQAGSQITVKGKVKRGGKDGKSVRIVATQIYAG